MRQFNCGVFVTRLEFFFETIESLNLKLENLSQDKVRDFVIHSCRPHIILWYFQFKNGRNTKTNQLPENVVYK